jgi:hypothetical protein
MRSLCFLLFVVSLFAEEVETQDMDFSPYSAPWFTGPLLAPSARVVKPGYLKVQLYWNTFVKVGSYDGDWSCHLVPNFYSEEFRLQLKTGLFDRVDFQATPSVVYQFTEHESSFHFGDIPLNLNIQILRPMSLEDGPNLKLSLITNGPTGKFQRLSRAKLKTDATGSGCWYPGFGLNLSQFWVISGHFLEIRATTEYRFSVPVRVKGFNTYGGNATTRGRVFPGNYYVFDTALQVSLTRHWAAACDVRFKHINRTRFSGSGLKCGKGSSEEWSLAPAIEYNFSKNIGLIGGVWFTIAGRNTSQFVNGMLSLVANF